jgi:hypothetical protein
MKNKLPYLLLFLLAACVPVQSNTPDLYYEAERAKATSAALQSDAEFYGRMLTGTAEAPIIHITQTAAAWQMEATSAVSTSQAMYTATQQANEFAGTATAQSWTATAIENAAQVQKAGQEAEQTAIANVSARDGLALERQQNTNKFWQAMPIIVFFAVLTLSIAGVFMILKRAQYVPGQVDARGNALPLLDVIEGTITDIDRAPTGQTSTSRKEIKLLPKFTPEQHLGVTQNDQMIDLATRGLPLQKSNEPQKRIAAQTMANSVTAGNLQNRFKLLDSGEQPPIELLDPEIVNVLEVDWKEADK